MRGGASTTTVSIWPVGPARTVPSAAMASSSPTKPLDIQIASKSRESVAHSWHSQQVRQSGVSLLSPDDDDENNEQSALMMSTSFSSKLKSRAGEFLSKYYRSRRDLPKHLSEGDVIEGYRLRLVVGRGAFSCVWRAMHEETGEEVAIKIIQKRGADVIQMVTNETAVWSSIDHNNIVQLICVVESQTEMCIVTELLYGGSFLDYIVDSEDGHLSEEEARPLFQQLFSVLHACHSRGIVHGDVKPENLLLGKDRRLITLGDFGLSYVFDRSKTSLFSPDIDSDEDDYFSSAVSAGSCFGTPQFVAPEVLCVTPKSDVRSDMWSAGVTLFAALVGRYPFDDDFEPRLHQKILNDELEIPDTLSYEARDLIRSLLVKDPSKRLQAFEAERHPWISGHLGELGLATADQAAMTDGASVVPTVYTSPPKTPPHEQLPVGGLMSPPNNSPVF